MKVNWLSVGALLAGVAVLLGAFAAHGLSQYLSAEKLVTFKTAVDYQFIHSIALLVVGLLRRKSYSESQLNIIGWCFFAGVMLFSGSLYLWVFSGFTALMFLTPCGGVFFIVAWFGLSRLTWKANQ